MRHNAPAPTLPVAMLGITHREAAVRIRERLVLREEAWETLCDRLRAEGLITGAVYLGTCNRTEFYVSGPQATLALQQIQDLLLGALSPADADGLEWSVREGTEALHHLFRVASSLDSLVLGDTEILAQVRTAYEKARQSQSTDKVLNQVFQQALSVGKGVRTHTSIQQRAASVASLVAQELRRVSGKGTIVVLGAGEIAQAVLRALKKAGPSVVVLNRSESSLSKLASDHQFTGGRLMDFIEHMHGAVALVSCLAVDRPLIDAAALAAATWGRLQPLQVYDLGVPRNIDPLARTLPGVLLHDMDDLQATVDANKAGRAAAAAEAEEYVRARLDDFLMRWVLAPVAPVLESLRGRKTLPPADLEAQLAPYLADLPPGALALLARQLGPALQQLPEPMRATLLADA